MDWNGIRDWITAEGTGHWFFVAFPVLLLTHFIWFRERRVRFLIPSLLITIVIVNPVFYKYWDQMGLYAYWRILWIVPVIPVLASLVPSITERMQKPWVKCTVVAVGLGAVALSGTLLYSGPSGRFVNAANAAKLPDEVVEIADRLLEFEERPRVVLQHPLGEYIRQYSGEINQLYGRDIMGFIWRAGSNAVDVHNKLTEGNLNAVATAMANDQYEYLITDRTERLSENGFEALDTVADYGIYRAHGKPTVVKERNELGQVVKVINVDENGQPVNNESGYATIEWQYDSNGNIAREFRSDINGIGIADSNGRAGYERNYDYLSHVIMERMIGPDGKPVANNYGYAEVRREYNGSNLVRESYYDADGLPVNRIDTRYATVEMAYDGKKNQISESYSDSAGIRVCSSAGYAEVKREYDDHRRLTRELYFDETGASVSIPAGYAGRKREYDANGNLTAEVYLGRDGSLVDNINGYAQDQRKYDQNRNIIVQRFLKASDELVITGAGYAEVHRIYDGKHLIREEYYGADGKPMTQTAGHTAIRQIWNGDTLASREYLDATGELVNRTDGYAWAVWEKEDNYTSVKFYAVDGIEVSVTGLNLAKDIRGDSDGWSDWMIPTYNIVNSCQNIGSVNLGPKVEGDVYSCTIEIEFRNVSATEGETLRFWTQGEQDGKWVTGNVWNGSLVNLTDVPIDGIYVFTSTVDVSAQMVDFSTFNIGFRCDFWASGMYRVRNVRIERGDKCSEWKPGV